MITKYFMKTWRGWVKFTSFDSLDNPYALVGSSTWNKDNVLISANGSAVLTDFATSRLRMIDPETKQTRYLRGYIRLSSPELLKSIDGSFEYPRYTKETDVWAFGMVTHVRCVNEHHRPYWIQYRKHLLGWSPSTSTALSSLSRDHLRPSRVINILLTINCLLTENSV